MVWNLIIIIWSFCSHPYIKTLGIITTLGYKNKMSFDTFEHYQSVCTSSALLSPSLSSMTCLHTFSLKILRINIFLECSFKIHSFIGALMRLMAAAVSQTCGLFPPSLTRNLCPEPAAASSTCLRTSLPWEAIPHVLDGELERWSSMKKRMYCMVVSRTFRTIHE